MKTETIAAIASGMTNSGIGIIRISGEDAFSVIDKIYRSKNGKKILSEQQSHTVHYGYVYDGDEQIDEVMVLLMKAPNTYTREDTVEIDCHGGVLVMRRILETVIRNGARPAEPGEFTKRAFLNGRIDLAQAESVMDLISSKNDFALKSSVSQLHGTLTGQIREIREVILHEIALIESSLDDPEHISLDGYREELYEKVNELLKRIQRLLDSSENGKLLSEGIQTVIVGKPNAGKSSLLNVLLKKERALVTDIAGTTRDVLEEQINLNGITLNLSDTAGIRKTDDLIERMGVDKTKEYLDQADLILYVVDSSVPLDENDADVMNLISDQHVIILLNKTDLSSVIDPSDIQERMDKRIISISTKDQTGIVELEDAIKEMFFHGEISFNDEVYITNIRHKHLLENVYQDLLLVRKSMDDGMPEDFFSIDLMSAYEELGSIIGESVEEDLVNEIFSKFCMGK